MTPPLTEASRIQTRDRFDLGAAFLRSLNVFMDHALLFLPLAILVQVFSGLAFFLLVRAYVLNNNSVFLVPMPEAAAFFFMIVLTRVVVRRVEGEDGAYREGFAFAANKFLPALIAAILFEGMVILGFVLLIVPGIYCAVVFSMFLFVLLFENEGVLGSFRRSRILLRGAFWQVVGIQTVVMFVLLAFVFLVEATIKLLGLPSVVRMIVSGVINTLALPLLIALYYQVFLFLKGRNKGSGRIAVYEMKEGRPVKQ